MILLTTFASALMQSQRGSIHSPHRMRKIIMKEWKKSVKFHLKENNHTGIEEKKHDISHYWGGSEVLWKGKSFVGYQISLSARSRE